jgi:hypothetical protein
MSPEKLNLKFDLQALQLFVNQLCQQVPPIMRSPAIGGWALQGHSGSYRDGWEFEFCPYNGPHNLSPAWTPRNSTEEKIISLQDFAKPTSINNLTTLTVLEKLQAQGFFPRRARIMKLSAGSSCVWHQDGNKNVYQVRLHIPIFTNDKCFFDYEDGSHHLLADGTAYLLKINRPHRVRNEGLTDRYHFVTHVWDTRQVSQFHSYDPNLCDMETDHPQEIDLAKFYNLAIEPKP